MRLPARSLAEGWSGMALIAPDDLNRVPGVAPTDAAQLAYVCDRASALVLGAWRNQVSPVPDWVTNIATDVAVRYLHNPKGLTSLTRNLDDAGRTERYESGVPGGGFYLTDRERNQLDPRTRRRGVGSIRLGVAGFRRDAL